MLSLHIFAVFCVALVASDHKTDCDNGEFHPIEYLMNYQAGKSHEFHLESSSLLDALTNKFKKFGSCDDEKNKIKICVEKRVGECVAMRPAEVKKLKELNAVVNASLAKLPRSCNKTRVYIKGFVYNYCVTASCEVKVVLPPPIRPKRSADLSTESKLRVGRRYHEYRSPGAVGKVVEDVHILLNTKSDDENDSSDSCSSRSEDETKTKDKHTGHRGNDKEDNHSGHHKKGGNTNNSNEHPTKDITPGTGTPVNQGELNFELDFHVTLCKNLEAQFVGLYDQFPSSYRCPAGSASAKFCAKCDRVFYAWLDCVSDYVARVLDCLKDLKDEIKKAQSSDDLEIKMCGKKV